MFPLTKEDLKPGTRCDKRSLRKKQYGDSTTTAI